jgi:hypothetical protein
VNVIQNHHAAAGDGTIEWGRQQQGDMTRSHPPPSLLQPVKPMSYCTVKIIYECPHSNKTHYEVRTWFPDPVPPPKLRPLLSPPLHSQPPPFMPCHPPPPPPPMWMNNVQHEKDRHYMDNEHEYNNCDHQMHAAGRHDEREEDWAPYEQGPQLAMDNMMHRPLPIHHRESQWQRTDPPFGHFSPTPHES